MRIVPSGLPRRCAVSMVVAGLLLSGCSGDSPDGGGDAQGSSTTTGTGATTPSTGKPAAPDFSAGAEDFRDDEAGFKIRYPKGWERYQSEDKAARLIASPNEADSLLVRVSALEEGVTLDQLKAYSTNLLTEQGRTIENGPENVKHGGLDGYAYRYTFQDGDQVGRHAHYFLVKPKDQLLYTIVLQALPADDFAKLATVFDEIMKSFETFDLKASPTTAPPESVPGSTPSTTGG